MTFSCFHRLGYLQLVAQDDGFVWELSGSVTDIVDGVEGVRAAPAGGGLALVTFSCFHRLGYLKFVAKPSS